MDYIKQDMEEPSLRLADATRFSSSDEDDFFSALQSSQAQDSSKQLDRYLACSADHMNFAEMLPSCVEAVCEAEHASTVPVKGYLASQDLPSVQEEGDWILNWILKNNSFQVKTGLLL